MKKIAIVNGPNLNLLGIRQPEVYGKEGFESIFETLKKQFHGEMELFYFQSNSEGALIDYLHEIGFTFDGIVLNAGAYTHTSVAIADAIAAIQTPVVEVHISNVHARESFRHHSFLTPYCKGVIAGFGLDSYRLGLLSFG
jgi:3-dehydroquinate dehydratase-2